jgi:hypothetical protein
MLFEAQLLQDTLAYMYEMSGNTKEATLMLPLTVMQVVHKRLVGSLAFPSETMKFHLKKTEALAFHNMYMSGIIKSNFVTACINKEIHCTL